MAVFLKLAPPAGADGETWTNTRETACLKAEKLLADMQADGMRDIELLTSAVAVGEGLWSFGFRHTITDVVVLLEVDGIDDYDAYCKTYLFSPKTYWNGGSDFEPHCAGCATHVTFTPYPCPDVLDIADAIGSKELDRFKDGAE